MKKSKVRMVSVILFALLFSIVISPMIGIEASVMIGSGLIGLSFVPLPEYTLGLNGTNNLSARQAYDHARKMFYRSMRNDAAFKGANGDQLCWDWVNALKLSQSEVRVECGMLPTSTNYKFGLTQNQANSSGIQFNTENRLAMQDSLCVNEYGIYVGQPSSLTDTTWKLATYGNAATFPAASLAAQIDSTFYSHGYFRMTCNNDVIMPYRGLFNHRYVPQTQNGVGITAQTVFGIDQLRGAEDGLVTTEPNIVLIGSKGYIPEIILPTAMSGVPAAPANTRMVIIFKGVLAQNSTTVS